MVAQLFVTVACSDDQTATALHILVWSKLVLNAKEKWHKSGRIMSSYNRLSVCSADALRRHCGSPVPPSVRRLLNRRTYTAYHVAVTYGMGKESLHYDIPSDFIHLLACQVLDHYLL